MYKYLNIELTPGIFKELLIEKFDGKQFKRADAIKYITQYHMNNGGLCEKNEYVSVFKKASIMLRENGMTNLGYGVWKLNYQKKETVVYQIKSDLKKITADEEYGHGNNAVYMYYYDAYRELAGLKGQMYFPCKIGRTDKDSLQRIIGQSGTSYPEKPHVALIFYCDNSVYLENAFHNILKIKKRWIKNAPGVEWFNTNVEEIKEIYNSIMK